MRSRVTAPRGEDAVLHVPLEFGMGCEAHVPFSAHSPQR
jgi:hypothetical protein